MLRPTIVDLYSLNEGAHISLKLLFVLMSELRAEEKKMTDKIQYFILVKGTVPVRFFSFVVVCCLFIMCNRLNRRQSNKKPLCLYFQCPLKKICTITSFNSSW